MEATKQRWKTVNNAEGPTFHIFHFGWLPTNGPRTPIPAASLEVPPGPTSIRDMLRTEHHQFVDFDFHAVLRGRRFKTLQDSSRWAYASRNVKIACPADIHLKLFTSDHSDCACDISRHTLQHFNTIVNKQVSSPKMSRPCKPAAGPWSTIIRLLHDRFFAKIMLSSRSQFRDPSFWPPSEPWKPCPNLLTDVGWFTFPSWSSCWLSLSLSLSPSRGSAQPSLHINFKHIRLYHYMKKMNITYITLQVTIRLHNFAYVCVIPRLGRRFSQAAPRITWSWDHLMSAACSPNCNPHFYLQHDAACI